MIEIENLTKSFDETCAVNHVSFRIPDGVMYGLLGTNGAGKTTLLRMLAGILEPDTGVIRMDGESVYGNPKCKGNMFYLSDAPYYFPNADMEGMVSFFRRQYPELNPEAVAYMAESLNLDMKSPLRTFSKGMKRQAFLIMALCTNTKYLLCDEVFDGLDPIVTEVMKNLIHQEMKERNLTVVVVSHKLRDLEDICHHIGILHKGGLLKAGDMSERAKNIRKFQCVFPEICCLEECTDSDEAKREQTFVDEAALREKGLDVVRYRREENFVTVIVREKVKEVSEQEKSAQAKVPVEMKRMDERKSSDESKSTEQILQQFAPVFCKEVPMTLEEVFVAEMEVTGYDIRKVLQ